MIVSLTGFMACGKTYFGKAAAALLKVPFVDLDDEVAAKYGSAADIFEREGEAAYRDYESSMLREILSREDDFVLALGGGTILREDSVRLLRSKTRVIWLDTAITIIWQEIGNAERPIAKGLTLDELSTIRVSREKYYRAAAHKIYPIASDDYDSITRTLAEIIRKEMAGYKKSVAVYLGSRTGNNPMFVETATEVGRRLAVEGYRLIYGGAAVGTMRAVAHGCFEAGGEVIGIFPKGFKGKPEVAAKNAHLINSDVTETVYTKDFAERKAKMEEYSDCCVILPGSWGTLDELFTYCTNTELKFNGGKPIFVLNLCGYYDHLKAQIEMMYKYGFIAEYSLSLVKFCSDLDELFTSLADI